jgi:hypothetical protein
MDGERTVGIIPIARTKAGMFSTRAYTLVFTTHRLILAEMTRQAVSAQVERSRAEAKGDGKGLMGQWGARLKSSATFGSQYLELDPEAVLAETPGNTAITPPEIRSMAVERKSRSAGAGDDTVDVSYLRVTVDTTAGRRSFDTDHEHPGLDEARALVTGLIGHH